ncbi:hypothetical protein ACFWVC_28200 [Streptomyces sp. NPDC058691]|uniref:hypothetical protein n=1 Tax=Streptomyces sp. NPDC058691 TaxID=3346601 RepID=UPI00365F3988
MTNGVSWARGTPDGDHPYLVWLDRLFVEAGAPSSRKLAEVLECSHATVIRLLKARPANRAMALRLAVHLAKSSLVHERSDEEMSAFRDEAHKMIALAMAPAPSQSQSPAEVLQAASDQAEAQSQSDDVQAEEVMTVFRAHPGRATFIVSYAKSPRDGIETVPEFRTALRELWKLAELPYARLAHQAGPSRTAVERALYVNQPGLPLLPTVLAIVRACGAREHDVERWQAAWDKVQARLE